MISVYLWYERQVTGYKTMPQQADERRLEQDLGKENARDLFALCRAGWSFTDPLTRLLPDEQAPLIEYVRRVEELFRNECAHEIVAAYWVCGDPKGEERKAIQSLIGEYAEMSHQKEIAMIKTASHMLDLRIQAADCFWRNIKNAGDYRSNTSIAMKAMSSAGVFLSFFSLMNGR